MSEGKNMDQLNLISIIVAIYNVGEYLEECMSSIVSQTYSNIEIILVDDGSTDESGEICDTWSNRDQRIHVIHQSNKGLVGCRKTGLIHAKGKYIAFVDGDDYIEPDMYEKLFDTMQHNSADVVNSGYYVGEERINAPKINFEVKNEERWNLLTKYIFDLKSEDRIQSSIWSKLFRANVIQRAYMNVPDDCSVGEDLLCLFYCFKQNISFCSINEQYYHYVQRQDSLMNAKNHSYFIKRLPYIYRLESETSINTLNEEMKRTIRKYIKHELMTAIRRSSDDPYAVRQYLIKNIDKLVDKKIVLYGAGDFGKDYYSQLKMHKGCNVVAWVDKNSEKLKEYLPVEGPKYLDGLDYDYVIPAGNPQIINSMRKSLIDMGVSESKILECDYEEED